MRGLIAHGDRHLWSAPSASIHIINSFSVMRRVYFRLSFILLFNCYFIYDIRIDAGVLPMGDQTAAITNEAIDKIFLEI